MTLHNLLSIIRCPVTGEPVTIAAAHWIQLLNRELEQKKLFNELGVLVGEKIEIGLVNESLSYCMMVRHHVPDLSPDHAIPIDHLEIPGST